MTQRQAPVLAPTAFRTLTGIGVMAGLTGLILNAALTQSFGVQALMLAAAIGALALATAIWRGRGDSLQWTQAGLVDAGGRVIAARGDITAVDRGAMSIKPSNGFTLRLAAPQSRRWQPGLYWRIGRRVGVGGLTSPGVAKALADMIALDLSQTASEQT